MNSPLNPWPWQTPECGIYFNMPFEDYLDIPCLQSSSLKRLLISPTDFWCNSWLYPFGQDFETEKKHYKDGTAYHMRILEGKKKFYETYAPEFEDDLEDKSVIRSSEDLKQALRDAGLAVTFPRKSVGVERLLAEKPDAKILENLQAAHKKKYGDKIYLSARDIRYIELSAAMIENHPDLKTFFAGGYPEVTVIWDDPVYGVRFKIRIDYQKINPSVDLKSFANRFNKPIRKAIMRTMDDYLYTLQAFIYMRGVAFARNFAAQGRVFTSGMSVDQEWLKTFSAQSTDEFWYVFVQKNVPVTRGFKLSRKDVRFVQDNENYLKEACRRFLSSYKAFGEDPWIDSSRPEYISCEDLWGWEL